MLIGVAITDLSRTRVLIEDSLSALRVTGPEGDHMYYGNLPGPFEALLDWLSLKAEKTLTPTMAVPPQEFPHT